MENIDSNIYGLYALNLPYPPIVAEKENLEDANIILVNYAGFVSELRSATQYYYHAIRLFQDNVKVYTTLKGISLVEIDHLEMLGEMALLLGGDPRYWIDVNKEKYYWNAANIDYGDSLEEFLIYDIQEEVEAIRQYTRSIDELNDPNAKELLKRIVLDERYHIELLNNLYQEFVVNVSK